MIWVARRLFHEYPKNPSELVDGQLFVWAFDNEPTLKLDMNVACVEVIAIGVLTPEFRAALKTVE